MSIRSHIIRLKHHIKLLEENIEYSEKDIQLLKSICTHENKLIEYDSDLPICALVSEGPVEGHVWRAVSCSDCGQNWREGNEP